MAVYGDAEDLINIGAYVKGSNEKIDYAIDVIDDIIGFIEQEVNEKFEYDEVINRLKVILK